MTDSRIDPDLLARLRSGDQTAASEFIFLYKEQVCRQIKITLRRCCDVNHRRSSPDDSFQSEVESAFNDAYDKLTAMIRKGKLDESLSPVAYMSMIVKNRWLGNVRKNKRISPNAGEDIDTLAVTSAAPADLIIEQELVEKLQYFRRKLNDRDQTLLHLRVDQGKSYAQIGHLLDLKENAVRARVSDVIMKLRSLCDKNEKG